MEATVTVTQFITVIIAILGLVLYISYILFGRIETLRVKEAFDSEQIEALKNQVKDLEIEQSDLREKRNQDLLDFTKILASINTTLGKFEVTLGHFEGTMKEVKSVVEELRNKE